MCDAETTQTFLLIIHTKLNYTLKMVNVQRKFSGNITLWIPWLFLFIFIFFPPHQWIPCSNGRFHMGLLAVNKNESLGELQREYSLVFI